jgi:hypothetical protein
VAGEVSEQHIEIPGRGLGGQKQVAAENGGGLEFGTDQLHGHVAGHDDPFQHLLGDLLFLAHPVIQGVDRVMELLDALHGPDFGPENSPVEGLGEKVIAAGVNAVG